MTDETPLDPVPDPGERLVMPGNPHPDEVIDYLQAQLKRDTFYAGWRAGFFQAFEIWGGERPKEIPNASIADDAFRSLEEEPELTGSVVDSEGVPDVDVEWRIFFQGWMAGVRYGHEQSEGKPAEFPPESVAFTQFEVHKATRSRGEGQ
ncbi:MAG TPA: hypothetical protein VFP17_12625 [Solirubrobacterales bacterium]|nr:hypothetical protein [Solirubrobacterales bacterium]